MSGENTRYADRLLQQAVFVFTFINPTSVFRRMDMLPHMGAAKTIDVMHMIALAWCDWMHTMLMFIGSPPRLLSAFRLPR